MTRALKVWVPAAVLAALFGVLAVYSPTNIFLVIAGLAVLVLVIRNPDSLIYLTLALSTVTLPAALPTTFSLGPISVKAYEPFLVASLIYVLVHYKGRIPKALLWFFATLVLWSAAGLLSGHELSKVIYDVRNLVIMLCACLVAFRVAGTSLSRNILLWIKGILWISAGFSVISSVTSLPLAGRSEEAALPVAGITAADSALRLLTPGTHLALAVLCVIAVLLITRHRSFRDVFGYMMPALMLVFISFSRNSILAIGVAVIFALLGLRNVQSFGRTVGYAGAATVGFWLLTQAASAFSDQPLALWISKQINGFSERVLGGLTSETLAVDNSAQFRFQMENALLIPKLMDSPLLGYGFGYAYKEPRGIPGSFTAEYAPYYAHNFYLWILLKAGIVGLLIFLWFSLVPIIRLLKKSEGAPLAMAGAATALLATSFVAPMPIGSPTALLLGSLLGVCYAAISPAPKQHTQTRISALRPASS